MINITIKHNVSITDTNHKRLKMKSAETGRTIQDLLDLILDAYFAGKIAGIEAAKNNNAARGKSK